ncbi:MAG: septum formation protein Maf [Clostridia bacterium]|nr:septum formation protein Maf [Clostridia bacterium]
MSSIKTSEFSPSRLVLASASPRRRELLEKAGAGFAVLPSEADEHADPSIPAAELVKILSARKAEATAALFDGLPEDLLILAADTVVEAPDGTVLGKPADEADAQAMLRALSGTRHSVYSGFTLLWSGGIYTESVASGVRFRPLTDADIDGYIASGEPMGKAGSYAIQGLGGAFVEALEGDFTNVVGLPMPALETAILKLFGKGLSDFTAPETV